VSADGHDRARRKANRGQFAAWEPVLEAGRCSHADAVRAEERRELERQPRTRWTAEELGDARR
jgi:hypothetical protein